MVCPIPAAGCRVLPPYFPTRSSSREDRIGVPFLLSILVGESSPQQGKRKGTTQTVFPYIPTYISLANRQMARSDEIQKEGMCSCHRFLFQRALLMPNFKDLLPCTPVFGGHLDTPREIMPSYRLSQVSFGD